MRKSPDVLLKCAISVCKAGYYENGVFCVLCSGNKIKTTVGDATDCDVDTPCDGTTKVPNCYRNRERLRCNGILIISKA